MYYEAEWEVVVHVLGLACAQLESLSSVEFKQDMQSLFWAGVMLRTPPPRLILKAFEKPYLFKFTTRPSPSAIIGSYHIPPFRCVKISLPLDYRYRAITDN
jgi:hypothetical protein